MTDTSGGEAAFGTPVPPSQPETAPEPAPEAAAAEPVVEAVTEPVPSEDAVPVQDLETALQQARDEATAAANAKLKATLYAHVDSFFG